MPQRLQPETTYGAILGSVLEIQRRDLGLDQNHLASHLEVTQATWSRIENGLSTLSVDQLARAAAALRVSPSEILRRVEQAIGNLRKQGIAVQFGNPRQLMQDGLPIIAAAALVVLVLAALNSK